MRTAEAAAEARRIEAMAEADSRQKLADAEAYAVAFIAASKCCGKTPSVAGRLGVRASLRRRQ